MQLTVLTLSLVALALAPATIGQSPCAASRPTGICAQTIRPYSDNEYVWSGPCEIPPPSDTSVLMADNVEMYDPQYSCNAGYLLTCCAQGVSCAVYEDCTGPETEVPAADPNNYPPELAPGWSIDMSCAVDNPQRVLANPVVSYLQNNSPYECAALCGNQDYSYAGVEYGDECYCGTGYVDGVMPPTANLSDCSMLCSGGYYWYCGGSWRMQVYKLN